METENINLDIPEDISIQEKQIQDDVETASRSMKAMSHPLRLMILCKLGEDEFSVQDIVNNVGTSQSNISQHLAILRDKGILSARKSANKVFYKVSDLKTLKLKAYFSSSRSYCNVSIYSWGFFYLSITISLP